MTNTSRVTSGFVAGIWLVVLTYSIIVSLPAISGSERRVLFFPDTARHTESVDGLPLIGEIRYLPYRTSINDDLRLLLKEVILGSADHGVFPLLPSDTNIITAQVIDDVAYLNLSHHSLFGLTPGPGTRKERLQAISDTILFNFPVLKRVYILVEGQEIKGGNVGLGGNSD